MRTRASVLHVDLDAFFAAVEQRDKPSLRGRPVVVGGVGGRGVVATCSYEARAYGVRSAMSTVEARARCPHAAYLSPRFDAYRAASSVVMAVLREVSGLVEQVSIDEAYLDLDVPPEGEPGPPAGGTDPSAAAAWLKAQIHERTELTASVGVGSSKLVAKIASDLEKPDGLVVVAPGTEADVLAPMSIRALPGIGPATQARLESMGIRTVGDLARSDELTLVPLLGRSAGTGLLALANARDDRPVVAERDAKSVSHEQTFATDVTDKRLLRDHLLVMVGKVVRRLVAEKLTARTVVLKTRTHDFATHTRSTTLPHPTDDERLVRRCALTLLDGLDAADGVRLLGVGVAGLSTFAQADLLADIDDADDVTPAVPDAPDADRADDTDPLHDALFGPVPDRQWRPGQDVVHPAYGAGWVWGSGRTVVTVRFEGPATGPGPVRSFALDDPDLRPAEPPPWPR
ncbi:DNA polymerase IV [Kineosporia sp. A_224]|uniref:DNA polymerase IV n=1 Tax=Kineosporia sp. A_224 TaxID=1962180 RepID=UPI000B4B6E66|nr:DNA polymerase IV [Kineosporia sp. A_224]